MTKTAGDDIKAPQGVLGCALTPCAPGRSSGSAVSKPTSMPFFSAATHAQSHTNAIQPIAIIAKCAPPILIAAGNATIANALPKYIPLVMKLTVRFLSPDGTTLASMECKDGNTVPIVHPITNRYTHMADVRLQSLGESVDVNPHSANATFNTSSPPYLVAKAPPGTAVYP